MAKKIPSQLLLNCEISTPLGRLSIAATLTHNGVSSSKKMRVLGKYAVVYLLRGSGFYQDSNNFKADLRAGDALLLFPELAHRYGPRRGEKWSEIYVVFDGPIFDLLRASGVLRAAQPIAQAHPIEDWHQRLRRILLDASGAQAGSTPPATRDGDAMVAVCAFAHWLAGVAAPTQETFLAAPADEWLTRARHLLDSNLEQKLAISSVARHCGISPESFRKRFALAIGTPPARYRAQRRIAAACALLDHPSMTTRAIAHSLGFSDEFHFARRFKQATGLTPRGYRQRNSH